MTSGTAASAVREPTPAEGLRARRRRQTRAELHAATVRLAREHGLEHVTVEMISNEAGVSPRTFFNYFRTKETALFAWPGGLTEAEAEQFVSAPGRGPDAVLRDLGDVFATHVDEMPPGAGAFEDVLAVVEKVPRPSALSSPSATRSNGTSPAPSPAAPETPPTGRPWRCSRGSP